MYPLEITAVTLFDSMACVDAFRRCVADPLYGPYAVPNLQVPLARGILKAAKRLRAELTPRFIRGCFHSYVQHGAIALNGEDRPARMRCTMQSTTKWLRITEAVP